MTELMIVQQDDSSTAATSGQIVGHPHHQLMVSSSSSVVFSGGDVGATPSANGGVVKQQASTQQQQQQFSLMDSFIGSDHNITLTQKDGKTVAILTLPPNSNNSAASAVPKPEQPKSIFGKNFQSSPMGMN